MVTVIIKRLTEVGYVECTSYSKDRRGMYVYLTVKGVAGAMRSNQIHAAFYEVLSAGIPPEELALTERTLQRMADNIHHTVWHRMEEHHGSKRTLAAD